MFTVKSRVFHVMTRTSETVPVLTQYDSCHTCSQHMKTGTGGAITIMNQYDMCRVSIKTAPKPKR